MAAGMPSDEVSARMLRARNRASSSNASLHDHNSSRWPKEGGGRPRSKAQRHYQAGIRGTNQCGRRGRFDFPGTQTCKASTSASLTRTRPRGVAVLPRTPSSKFRAKMRDPPFAMLHTLGAAYLYGHRGVRAGPLSTKTVRALQARSTWSPRSLRLPLSLPHGMLPPGCRPPDRDGVPML